MRHVWQSYITVCYPNYTINFDLFSCWYLLLLHKIIKKIYKFKKLFKHLNKIHEHVSKKSQDYLANGNINEISL